MKANFETGLKICSRCHRELPIWASENNSKNNSVPDNVEELVEFLKQEKINNDNN